MATRYTVLSLTKRKWLWPSNSKKNKWFCSFRIFLLGTFNWSLSVPVSICSKTRWTFITHIINICTCTGLCICLWMHMAPKVSQKGTPLAPSSVKDSDDRKRGSCLFSVGQSPPSWVLTDNTSLIRPLSYFFKVRVPRNPDSRKISRGKPAVDLPRVCASASRASHLSCGDPLWGHSSMLTLGSYMWLQWAPGATFSSGRKFT